MRFFSIIAYIISAVCMYTSLLMGWGINNFNIFTIWDLSAFMFILAGFTLSIINFKFSEVFRAVKNALSSSVKSYDILSLDKKVLQSSWNYLLFMTAFSTITVLVIIFANAQLNKLGPSLAVMSIIPLYTLILKFFIFMPLEISIEKKIIQVKPQQSTGQVY